MARREKETLELTVFEKFVFRFGTWSSLLTLALFWGFPLIVSLYFGIFPDFAKIMPAILTFALVILILNVTEILTFSPTLGPGALYMCFVTGNTSNLKCPCALSALKANDIPTGTREAHAISVLSIGVSSIVTVIILAVGAILIVPLTPILSNPVLKPAFDNVMPAMFGGLCALFLLPSWKYSIAPLIVAFICVFGFSLNAMIALPACVAISILVGRIGYKRTLKKEKSQADT